MFKYEDFVLSEEIIADVNEKVSKYNEKFLGAKSRRRSNQRT